MVGLDGAERRPPGPDRRPGRRRPAGRPVRADGTRKMFTSIGSGRAELDVHGQLVHRSVWPVPAAMVPTVRADEARAGVLGRLVSRDQPSAVIDHARSESRGTSESPLRAAVSVVFVPVGQILQSGARRWFDRDYAKASIVAA